MSCPRTDGLHLPRVPASMIAMMSGFNWSCAYCGRGCNSKGEDRKDG